ncbi:MAG: hypothetical protein M3P26_13275, partial [Gemmatimonadota bacterium]|nr:hypothetical protein [Gemmatimonadota bacterium]
MSISHPIRRRRPHSMVDCFLPAALAAIVFATEGCAFFQFSPAASPAPTESRSASAPNPTGSLSRSAPTPDPRIGLKGGAYDAAEAIWNLKV